MQTSKRGQRAAISGLVVQLALAALAALLFHATGSPAAQAGLWLVILPLPLWVITLLMFYCQWLQRREAEEIRQLAERPGQTESIFRDQDGELHPADNRLKWMRRYMVPAFTLVFASCHAVAGILLLRWVGGIAEVSASAGNAASMFFAIGGAFVAFLVSRYAIGMAKAPSWRMLRAPGSYLFTNSLILVLLACALAAEHYEWPIFGVVVAYVLPVFAIIVGAELVLNFVLDLYRPRLPDGEARYSYDSRLLNLIASPESIGHSIAEALNYQFGFEVSGTWFYKLLQRTLVPLLLVGAIFIWLMSSVVVVEEGEQYTVLHWGKPQRVLKPRRYPHLVWPWPVDTTRKFETDAIHQIILGVGTERSEKLVNGKMIYLWTEEHGPWTELDTLVAKQPDKGEASKTEKEKIPSVNLIKLTVGVYYRINDAYKFGYNFADAPKLLDAIAYREMVQYAASATLMEKLPDDEQGRIRPQGILSFGRGKAASDLHERIAKVVSPQGLDLGVEIVRVEILGSHPPKDAAPAFQDVIAAEREQDRMRYEAEADANQMLAAVAGETELALTLSQTITFGRELTDLESCRRKGGDLDKAVKDALRKAQENAKGLKDQIELERRLGKITPGKKTVAQRLLERQEAFLEILMQIQSKPAKSDTFMSEKIAEANKEAGSLFGGIEGQAAVTIAKAQAERWEKEFAERARAETFDAQLMCLRAAPLLYRFDKHLAAVSAGIKDQKKYVLGVDRKMIEIWLNLEEPSGSMSDIPLGKK